MRVEDRYDVICSGGGLSAYLCGALLAKAGKRVLLVDEPGFSAQTETGAEIAAISGFQPGFPLLTGLPRTGVLDKCLSELGIETESALFENPNPITQVLSEDFRITFYDQVEATIREIEREIPSGKFKALEFFRLCYRANSELAPFVSDALKLGQAGTGDRLAWRRFWGSHFAAIRGEKPRPLNESTWPGAEISQQLSQAILGGMSYVAPFNLGVEQVLRSLAVLLHGKTKVIGAETGLKNQLEEWILRSGGAIKRNASIQSIVTEGDDILGLLLSSYEGIIKAPTIVLGCRLRRLYGTLPSGLQDPAVVRALNRLDISHWRFTVGVTVPREAIPIGATSSMVSVGTFNRPLEEENFLHIQIPPGSGPVTVLVTALVPYRASSLDYAYLRRLAGKMLHGLSRVLPFVSENILGVYPDFRQGEEPIEKAYPFGSPDWVPESLVQFYLRGDRLAQDFWGPSWTTPHKGMYFSGRGIWPSLGMYGEALVARKICDDILGGGHHD